MDLSLAALDFSYEGLNTAGSMRLQLWNNALSVLESPPINGVGVRAYRYAYPEYAQSGDIFISPDGTGAIYAHQLLLEVGSETGVIGLAGLLVFFGGLIRSGRGGWRFIGMGSLARRVCLAVPHQIPIPRLILPIGRCW
ncbi:MAG: O-antigen ligase family protein [Pseudomonadota bacterium]